MKAMDRRMPILTRLSAVLALLVAALAAGPIDTASARRTSIAERGLLAERAAPLPDQRLADSVGQDEKRSSGNGAPPILSAWDAPAAPSVGPDEAPPESAERPQAATASYQARAPPAA